MAVREQNCVDADVLIGLFADGPDGNMEMTRMTRKEMLLSPRPPMWRADGRASIT